MAQSSENQNPGHPGVLRLAIAGRLGPVLRNALTSGADGFSFTEISETGYETRDAHTHRLRLRTDRPPCEIVRTLMRHGLVVEELRRIDAADQAPDVTPDPGACGSAVRCPQS